MKQRISFSENKLLDAVARERAEIMFGKDWEKNTKRRMHGNVVRVFGGDGWKMQTGTSWLNNAVTFSVTTLKHGKEHDPVSGVPAVTRYRNNGVVVQTTHFQNGLKQNPSEDVPADREYWSNGAIRSEKYYVGDNYSDRVDGWPAKVYYDKNGSIGIGESATNGTIRIARMRELRVQIKSEKLHTLCSDTEIIALGGKGHISGGIHKNETKKL